MTSLTAPLVDAGTPRIVRDRNQARRWQPAVVARDPASVPTAVTGAAATPRRDLVGSQARLSYVQALALAAAALTVVLATILVHAVYRSALWP